MTEKIGSLIIDVKGKTLSSEDREILNHPMVGGVILFAANYESRDQLTQLCQQIRTARKAPLLIMVDQEGGRVQRFIHEFTRLPFMAEFGKIYNQDKNLGCNMAQDCAWLMASELLSSGVDLSLAPVLDVNRGVSTVIGERAFHSSPEDIVTLATAFIRGMHEAGMASTGKHFPGHGSVKLDSHVANPVDERSLNEIEKDDMLSFAGMIKNGIKAIMAAHIVFPNVDALPVGYSPFWLKKILRDHLKFNGVIFSDDLSMEGANISLHYTDRVKTAMDAGCDFVLLCNKRDAVITVLDDLENHPYQIDASKWQLLQGKKNGGVDYQANPRWIKTRDVLNKLTIGN